MRKKGREYGDCLSDILTSIDDIESFIDGMTYDDLWKLFRESPCL